MRGPGNIVTRWLDKVDEARIPTVNVFVEKIVVRFLEFYRRIKPHASLILHQALHDAENFERHAHKESGFVRIFAKC